MANRETGALTWFDNNKGYGFIKSDDGIDFFVHHTYTREKGQGLKEGDRVEFTITQSKRGLQADDVTILI